MSKLKIMKSLESIAKELDLKISRREDLLKESRASIALSSRAIVNIHTGKKTQASQNQYLPTEATTTGARELLWPLLSI